MKTLFSVLSFCALALSSAQAGVPTTVCSTADGGIRLKSEFSGMQHLEITTNHEGAFERLERADYRVKETEVNVLSSRTSGGAMGRRSTQRIYSAKLTITKADGSAMPDAYAANVAEDGSLTVHAICRFSSF